MSNKVPQIRFNGYSDDWEERKLSDISNVTKLAGFEFTKYVRYQESGKIIALRGLNVKNGNLVLDDVKYIDNSDFSKLNRSKLYKNDILLTYVGTVGELAIVPEDDKYYLAPNVARIRLQDHVSSIFVCQMMNDSNFYNRIILPLIATSSQPALSMENVRKFQLLMPDYQEQQKIGSFFKQLDETMALHQRKLDLLKEQKKGYLQKMFPRNGAKVPELRFAGFADDWEERKLSDIADRFDNLRVPITASDRKSGDTPYYGANGIQDYVEGFTHDGEFILVAEDGANDLKNYPVQYVNGKVWVNNHAHVLQGKKTITDNKFLMNSIKNFNIEPFLVGGGRAKLNADVMMKLNVLLPTFEEQEKIGSFFKQLDDTITLHQRKLDLLKEQKKGLLQKMFV